MIELLADSWGKKVTVGAVTVELEGLGTNRIGALVCQLSYGLSQTDEVELEIVNGYFSITVDTRPFELDLGGNILTEADDPNNIGFWQYYWNPISKLLVGRVG